MPQESADDRTYHGNRGLAPRDLVGLVRRMGLDAMSERTWSVRLSINDLNASIFLLESDAEVAAWARGLMRGLNAGEAKEDASKAYASGWEIGSAAREKADAIRAGLAENGRAGGVAKASKRIADATAIATADATAAAEAFALAEPRTKKQRTKNKEQQEHQPPSREEWERHARENFPWWPKWDMDKAFAYWSNENWTREGKRTRSDWRRLMGTWAGKWARENPRDFEAASKAPQIINGNRLPSGFRPLGKAVEVQAVLPASHRELSYAEQQQLLPMSQRWKP